MKSHALTQEERILLQQEIAERIADILPDSNAGPYASDRRRYLLLTGELEGEIIPTGRPTRGHRLFPSRALKRNLEILRQFEAFAAEQDQSDWKYWTFKLPGCKADINNLKGELIRFNKDVDSCFTGMRRMDGFEMILITVHVRYHQPTNEFDLHAHVICRIPPDSCLDAAGRVSDKFSCVDVPNKPIENAAAVATYILWGIYDFKEVVTWPDEVLKAAWNLQDTRPKLVRSGKAFAAFRRAQRQAKALTEPEKADRNRKRRNRQETAYAPPWLPAGDRLLSRVYVTVRGQMVWAYLCEERPATSRVVSPSNENYSSATVTTTQTVPDVTSISGSTGETDTWHTLASGDGLNSGDQRVPNGGLKRVPEKDGSVASNSGLIHVSPDGAAAPILPDADLAAAGKQIYRKTGRYPYGKRLAYEHLPYCLQVLHHAKAALDAGDVFSGRTEDFRRAVKNVMTDAQCTERQAELSIHLAETIERTSEVPALFEAWKATFPVTRFTSLGTGLF